ELGGLSSYRMFLDVFRETRESHKKCMMFAWLKFLSSDLGMCLSEFCATTMRTKRFGMKGFPVCGANLQRWTNGFLSASTNYAFLFRCLKERSKRSTRSLRWVWSCCTNHYGVRFPVGTLRFRIRSGCFFSAN